MCSQFPSVLVNAFWSVVRLEMKVPYILAIDHRPDMFSQCLIKTMHEHVQAILIIVPLNILETCYDETPKRRHQQISDVQPTALPNLLGRDCIEFGHGCSDEFRFQLA